MLDAERGDRITQRMEEQRLTVEELAELCEVSTQVVYKWRKGHTLPSNRVIQLKVYLNCTTDFILLGVERVENSRWDALLEGIPVYERELLFAYLKASYSNKK